MSPTILFLCPHAAAKSVIAAADFQQLAERYGLDVQAHAAGTEPDEKVSSEVVELLCAEGLDVSAHQPRRVTAEALAAAHYIVSMGCNVSALETSKATLIRWDDLPAVSAQPQAARAAIRAQVESLVYALRAA